MGAPWEDYATTESPPWEDYKTVKAKKENSYGDDARNFASGIVRGAGSIGSTLLAPYDMAVDAIDGKGLSLDSNRKRRKSIDEGLQMLGADQESGLYKGGKITGEILGTAGAGGVLAKGASLLPKTAAYADALASGGLNLGNAATGSKLANAAIRTGAGAIQGATQAAAVNPEDAGTGAMIGGLVPSGVAVAGKVGNAINSGVRTTSRKLMNSALKPSTVADPADVNVAIDTLLNNGINVSRGGAAKLQNMIRGTSQEVDSMVNAASGNVSKQDVLKALDRSTQKFATQATPTKDLKAIRRVRDEFERVWPDQIPVPVAHQLKKGTYTAINSKNYGELSGATTEAQKDIARGLKEGVENLVSGVKGKNKSLQEYMTTMQFLDRAAGRETNKDILGLALLAGSPEQTAAMELSRNALLKSYLARAGNSAANGMDALGLPNLTNQYGLLGAPVIMGINP